MVLPVAVLSSSRNGSEALVSLSNEIGLREIMLLLGNVVLMSMLLMARSLIFDLENSFQFIEGGFDLLTGRPRTKPSSMSKLQRR